MIVNIPSDVAERRDHGRYVIKGCNVQYKPLSFLGLRGKFSGANIILDISQSGVQFITPEKFKKQTRLALNITAPFLEGKMINIRGYVLWTRELNRSDVHSVGIKYVAMEQSDRTRLISLLYDTVLKKLEYRPVVI